MKKLAVFVLLSVLSFAFVSQNATGQVERRRVTVEGRLEIRFEDPIDGIGRQSYFLNTGEERIELDISGSDAQPVVGSRIRATGRFKGGKLKVEDGTVVEAASINTAIGEQRQLLMLFNFQDNPNNKPWTAAYIQDLLFNQVNQYYNTVSYGQTWITGDMVGWFTIPVNSTDCAANKTQAAEDGARAHGFDPSLYTHKIYIYPSTSCGSSGGTTWVSTDSSGNVKTWIYITGTATPYVLTHEFGHSLGFRHSNSLNCGSVTFGSSCTHVEYGDNYDVMGYYNNGVVNGYYRDRAGWLGQRIQTVTSDGTYTLTPTSGSDIGLKAIKIAQAYDQTTNSTTYYYIEYRQPVGYDTFLANYPGVTNGVLIRLGTIGSDTNKLVLGSELLNATPAVTGANQALAVGKSYYDPAVPLTVTVLSADTSGALVSVHFSAPTCSPTNPTVTVSPSTSTTSSPGASVPYTVSVNNNDGVGCAASAFDLKANLPSGWTASFATPTLTANPGTIASTTMMVTSAPSAASGLYSIGVTASNSASPVFTSSGSSSLNVATSLAVTVSTDKSSYNRKQSVSMTAKVSVNGMAVSGAGVSFTMTKSNGASIIQTASTNSTGSATVRFQLKRSDPVGTYQGRGIATQNKLSGSGVQSFTVQ